MPERSELDIRRGAAEVHREAVAELPRVSQARRTAMLTLPPDRETHRKLVKEVEALRLLEAGGAIVSTGTIPLRVVYWNVQQFHHFDACCALIRKTAPDILLLGELDIGMARTDQRHCLRDAATTLGANYVFGTEFLELGLGDERERLRYAGSHNESGFHGNGILSRLRLESPALIRLETDGDWFDGGHGERQSRRKMRCRGVNCCGRTANCLRERPSRKPQRSSVASRADATPVRCRRSSRTGATGRDRRRSQYIHIHANDDCSET